MQSFWEHFEHQADIGVRGGGRSIEEAFAQVALALTAVTADPQTVHAVDAVSIRCEAPDAALLLVDWLNALICEMSARNMLFSRFDVQVREPPVAGSLSLTGTAWGERVDPPRHQPAVEVKAASYLGLSVRRSADGAWVAECIVDV
jgi:SHS2 domain-containing protein